MVLTSFTSALMKCCMYSWCECSTEGEAPLSKCASCSHWHGSVSGDETGITSPCRDAGTSVPTHCSSPDPSPALLDRVRDVLSLRGPFRTHASTLAHGKDTNLRLDTR